MTGKAGEGKEDAREHGRKKGGEEREYKGEEVM